MSRNSLRCAGSAIGVSLWLALGWTLCTGTARATTTVVSGQPTAQAGKPAQAANRPVIGLVLSGGGARGFAHVGILKALEEAHVPVDLVVGTSMGAIVGGLYASGMSPQALEAELMAVPWATLFDRRAPRPTLPQRRKEDDFELSPVVELGFRNGEFRAPTGAVSTRSLEWLLRRLTLPTRQLATFDQLPTRFRAVATDLESGEQVTLSQGDLAAALRASMSVPGVFSPMEMDDRILGDGGLVNNLPVDVARALGAEVVIAVNIGTPLAGREKLSSVLGISEQMINILTEQNVQRSVATLTVNDLLLAPELGKLTAADFEKAPDLLQLGLAYGRSVTEALARFSVPPSDYAQWQLARQPLASPTPGALASVGFDGVAPTRTSHLRRLLDTQPGMPLEPAKLEADLLQLSASGDYDHVDYRLIPDPQTQQDGLVFELKENLWGPNYLRAGLDLHTDFSGASGFNLRIRHSRHWLTETGTEWRNQVQIGATTEARTELYHPWGGDRDRYVSLHASARNNRVELFSANGDPLATYNRNSRTLGLDHGWSLGRGGKLGTAALGLFSRHRSVDSPLVNPERVTGFSAASSSTETWTEHGLRLRLVTDQLDQANFPRQGHRSVAELEWGRRTQNASTKPFRRLDWTGNHVASWGLHTWNSFVRVARASDLPAGALDEYSLGGFQQLSGFKPGQVVGNYLALARLGYYRRLGLNPGVARGYYVGGSVEAGNAWRDSTDIRWGGLKSSFSIYGAADTGLGPVYLALVKGKGQSAGVYLFLGRP